MTNVEFRKESINDNTYVDMFYWCQDEFGDSAWGRIENISEYRRWGAGSDGNKLVFRFYNENDATLFKLTWCI